MRITPDLLLGLTAQVPLSSHNGANLQPTVYNDADSAVDASRAFTPKDLVEQPSVGTGVPNPAGTLLFVPYSKWSVDTDTESHFLRIHSLDALLSREFLHEISLPTAGDAFWYDDTTLVTAVPNATDRSTSLYASYFSEDAVPKNTATALSEIGKLVGVLPTDSATFFRYSPAAHTLVFTARVFPDGDLTTAVEQERAWTDRKGTARAYDGSSYVRFWDKYGGPTHSSLFSTSLFARSGNLKWHLGDSYVNLLNGTGHKVPGDDSVGSTAKDDFDISASQVVYTAKDPSLREAFNPKKNVYLVTLDGRSPSRELTTNTHGGAFNPVFSPDGKMIAWLEYSEGPIFAGKSHVVLYDIRTDKRQRILQAWDRSPGSIAFSTDSTVLYLTVPDMARVKVFACPLYDTAPDTIVPVALTSHGDASGLHPLSNGRLIYTVRTLNSPGNVVLLSNNHAATPDPSAIVSQEVTQLSPSALDTKHIFSGMEEFWFDGDARKIHGYVLKPRGWTTDTVDKAWPIVLLIHGGPQDVWGDSWSVTFNSQVFSQRGYFVVAINPTGSISFGQAYTNAVIGDWGGAPLRDIAKGLKHVYKKYPEINPKRTVAVGFSYGGYMVNLLQGHARAEGLEFAAMANMGGVFNTEEFAYTVDDLSLMQDNWLGWPWQNKSHTLHDAFSPHKFVHHWETPQIMIHGTADFRVPVTEGIATFHALQQRGVPSKLLIFDKEPHVYSNRHNILVYYDIFFNWFELFAGTNDSMTS